MLGSTIEVRAEAHAGRRGPFSQSMRPAQGYDRLPDQKKNPAGDG